MNFQYYDTLVDKSEESMLFYLENIEPKFSESELNLFFQDMNLKNVFKSVNVRKGEFNEFFYLNENIQNADLGKLKEVHVKALYQCFISKEINTTTAVKWRFYQNLKYIKDLELNTVQIKITKDSNKSIDLVLETKKGEIYFVECVDILDLDKFKKKIESFIKFVAKNEIKPNKLIIVSKKTYRNIPIDEPITINEDTIPLELWIEYEDPERSFKGEDLLIVRSDSEHTVAGFNFGAIEDLLNYVYKYTNGGQISIYKQNGYFSENVDTEQDIKLIWKGIMLKKLVN